mmetsp:Transcript_49750/g.121456  ORF Transcript_49750/g.121456 Transcript_49750/m.121456 type:complete len:314 (-) Transcript_49750:45-986(-)
MGTDDTARAGGLRVTRATLISIFVGGIMCGVVLTLLASAFFLPDDDDEAAALASAKAVSRAPGQGRLRDKQVYDGFWIETVSDHPNPRIFILHNLLTPTEAQHLKSLGLIKGMESALIIPYGQKDLVQSSTRTNTAAWLAFGQDAVVRRLEQALADVTETTPQHGENLQILHYADTQKFSEHHDYFDPDEDPPENFEPGGNRIATALIYLENAEEGGETDFVKLGLKLKPSVGDALLFYDLLPDGRVDKRTVHAGTPPTKGEKWVATKWIHERKYQGQEVQEDAHVYRQPSDASLQPTASVAIPKGERVAIAA